MKPANIQLSTWEKVQHYFFPALLVALPTIVLFVRISSGKSPQGFTWFEGLVILFAGLIIIKKRRDLAFTIFQLDHAPDDFKAAASATSIELNWTMISQSQDAILAEKHGLGWQHEGLRITILRENETIYFNSMVAPSLRSNPFSLGWNRKNLKVFQQNLLDAANGKNVVAEARSKVNAAKLQLENEPEWNLKNTLKRLFVYICICILLGACGFILSESFNFLVLPIMAFCVYYLFIDWKIILKKWRKRKIE